MESAAIEKLDELISESQHESEDRPESSPALFPLDQDEIIREIEVVYDEDTKITLYHKLKWPTLDALDGRQRQTPYKSEVLGGGRVRAQNDDGVAANAWLWDKFRSQVKGYEWDGIEPDQWIDVSDALAAEIPQEHKSEAIVGLFASRFEVERPKGKGFRLGAQTYRVKQTYGPYTIIHVFGKPSEKDRRDLARKSRETHGQPGAVKARSEVFTNLKPYWELYDKIFHHLEGVKGEGQDVAQRKDLVSGIWKYGAIEALMESFEATRRDSSTN